MYVGSSGLLKKYDEYLLEHGYGIEELVAKAADCLFKHFKDYQSIAFLVGPGNNGADALCTGLMLHHIKKQVVFYYCGEPDNFSKANQYYYDKCLDENLTLIYLNDHTIYEFAEDLQNYDCIGDGFFGFGLHSSPRGIYADVIELINSRYNKDILAIDIPTGLNCNTGYPYGAVLYATKTISLTALKEGYLNPDSQSFCGEIVLETLDVENVFMEAGLFEMVDDDYVHLHLKERKFDGYKNYYGTDLIIAGSDEYKGAPLLAAKACLNSGAGIVKVMSVDSVIKILPLSIPEAIGIKIHRLSETDFEGYQAVMIGSGLGLDLDAYNYLLDTLQYTTSPLIIDGDGLTILSNNLDLLKKQKRPVILTPHLGEFKRLTDYNDQDDIMEKAVEFAREYESILVLKGPRTIVTNGYESYRMTSGNKAMAVGGMGDTLAGMITAFLGQKYDPLTAVILAVYIHGFTGDMLAKKRYTVLPSKLSDMIPSAMFVLSQNYKIID